jgi:hypothetical protein
VDLKPTKPRQKKIPEHSKKGLEVANAHRPLGGLPVEARKEKLMQALQRVMDGESTKQIAEDYGISRTGLNDMLLKYCEDDWRRLQIARALTRKEEAEDAMDEKGGDGLALAYAREKLKAAQWNLEKLLRRMFGQDQPLTASNVTINIGGIQRQGATIEHSPGTEDAQVIDSTESKHSR